MLSVSILEMYATQFESLVKVPKRTNEVRSYLAKNEAATVKNDEAKAEEVRPQINYFTGPHCVFYPNVK